MKVVLLLFLVAVVSARPQLDLPPLVAAPPLQIFIPELQVIRVEPEQQPQPQPQAQPPPQAQPQPQPQPQSQPQPQPQPQPQRVQTTNGSAKSLRNELKLRFSDLGEIVGYSYAIDTDNGIQKEETGEVKQLGPENEGIAVTGRYSYIGVDGKRYAAEYTADERGFRPKLTLAA